MIDELPRPSSGLVILTQVLLAMMFAGGLVVFGALPVISTEVARSVPEYASLRVPLLILALTFTALGLATLVLVSLLVRRIHRGTILTPRSVRWVDGTIAALLCADAVIVATFVTISNGQAGSPAIALLLLLALLTLSVVACVTLVLRSLLREAIVIQRELAVVV